MEAACFTEIFITTYKTTWCHNPEDHNVDVHHCEIIKSYTKITTAVQNQSRYSVRCDLLVDDMMKLKL
jgi:hypothetical protein